jgi:hypothetical protein
MKTTKTKKTAKRPAARVSKPKAATASAASSKRAPRKGLVLFLFLLLGLGLATQGYLLWRRDQKSKLILTFSNVLSNPGRNQPGLFCCARDMAVAPDGGVIILEAPEVGGSLQILSPEGQGKFYYKPGKPDQVLNQAFGVAAGPDGTVYVLEANSGMVKVLSKELKYERSFSVPTHNAAGLAVSAAGDLYIADRERVSILVVDNTGAQKMRIEGGQGAIGGPYRLNFGPDGNLYVLDFPRGMNDEPDIKVFKANGDFVTKWTVRKFAGNPYNTIAVHPKGYVFLNDNRGDSMADGIHVYTLKGKLLGIAAVSTNNLNLKNISNMAIDPQDGDIYLNTNTIGRGGDRFSFNPDETAAQ